MRFKILISIFILVAFSIPIALACNPYWQPDPVSCGINNSYILTYHDVNNCNSSNVPYDNGTARYCNYCSEDLVQIDSSCINSSKTISWVDNNYYSCCAITNQPTDCNILTSPYNSTQNETCFYSDLVEELGTLDCQTQPNLGVWDKEYCIAHIPLNYTNETFKCIGIITDGSTGEIIQTTPEYRETSQTFFNLHPDAETRQWFTPANNIVNFYYTGKNLNPDKDFVLTIECSSTERTLKSQMPFEINYEDVSFVFFRTRWLMGNAPYIIGGVIVLILICLVAYLIIKGVI